MFAELRELLRSEAIRRHQLGSKYLIDPQQQIIEKYMFQLLHDQTERNL